MLLFFLMPAYRKNGQMRNKVRRDLFIGLRQQWNSVLFSDESMFTIHPGDGRVRVYRRRNKHANCCVLEQDRFGVEVLSCSGRALHMAFAHISSLSKGIRMPNTTERNFLRYPTTSE